MARVAARRQFAAERPDAVSDATLRGFSGYNMKRTFNVMQADLTRTLEPFGLRMVSFTALILIVDNPGLSQSQLAAALSVERSNLVLTIDDLEQRELIGRNAVPNDRRSYALHPTPAGKRLCGAAVRAVQDHDERMLRGLDETERENLIRVLRHIERDASGGMYEQA